MIIIIINWLQTCLFKDAGDEDEAGEYFGEDCVGESFCGSVDRVFHKSTEDR